MSSSDSEFEGLERVSSVKERKEKCYSEVPENKKYKLKIIDTEKTDKIGYKLKKGTKLPYNTILKGSNSSISATCLISIYSSLDYDVCFEKSLKPVLKGFSGSEYDGWWTFEIKEGETILITTSYQNQAPELQDSLRTAVFLI